MQCKGPKIFCIEHETLLQGSMWRSLVKIHRAHAHLHPRAHSHGSTGCFCQSRSSLQEKLKCPCSPGFSWSDLSRQHWAGAGMWMLRVRLCPGCSTKPHGSAPWKWIWICEVWCCGCEQKGWVLLGRRHGCSREGWMLQGMIECSREEGMSASGKGGVLGEERMGAPVKEWVL